MQNSLPDHDTLREALVAVQRENNGGLGNHMWASLVDRNGLVTAVAFSGSAPGDQWPASRLIAAEKAFTANSLSLDAMALSTANLYASTLPGGPLFGIAFSASFNVPVAFGGNPADYGSKKDPLVGHPLGGVIVFGGGLALYTGGKVVGGLGVSGDLSCADHNIAWKLRHALALDYVPAGVNDLGNGSKDDNIIYDFDADVKKSASGWGHPSCSPETKAIGESLSTKYAVRR